MRALVRVRFFIYSTGSMKGLNCLFLFGLLLWEGPEFRCGAASGFDVSIITDARPRAPVKHGLETLKDALGQKNVSYQESTLLESAPGKTCIVVGLAAGNGSSAQLVQAQGISVPGASEAFVVKHCPDQNGKSVWLIAGSDERGLMYGELEVAERLGWSSDSGNPFSEVRDTVQKPAVTTRAVSIYTMNRAYWESRFYDEAYWARYLDTLARNRFNSLVVIFGYENGGFLAPCYPYFFDVDAFPDVRMVGITSEQQQRNLTALNHLVQMAHEHGLEFSVGIWDHIYRGGVQGGGVQGADETIKRPTPGLVWGVTATNLSAYSKAALAEFVDRVPGLDGIQFRMHDESGLKNSEQAAFWREAFGILKQKAPSLRLDLRAKGLPDAVIQDALNSGVRFRITTKYWMEQMGLPFHPTHINAEDQQNRRHSYADLLRYPQQYQMHWRLWNGGTARVLLWGDPDYARRFVESTHLYGDDGFEVNEPLCTKMEAQPHDARPFELMAKSHRYYDYEFERYWHFFQVFGRLGYNPDTPSRVWDREFQQRFGPETGPLIEQALHKASWILPRIIAACYPYSYFPMTRGWAEKQRLGDLPSYAMAEGSDTAQFASFDEEAELLITHGETAKTRPAETSRWFAQIAQEINGNVHQAEQRSGPGRTKEFDSTITDLEILSNLALYHARRIPAAVSYRLFERTQDPQALEDAISYERNAVDAWRQLVNAAGDFYAEDLMMGVRSAGLCGHWKDELIVLEKEVTKLEDQRRRLIAAGQTSAAPRYVTALANGDYEPPLVTHQPITNAPLGKPLAISAEVRDASGVKWVHLRYRGVNQRLEYQTLPMRPTGRSAQYQAVIPVEQLDPKWDLMYFIEVMDTKGNGKIYPDLSLETPYIVVKLAR
jgi:hypothetical protein